MDVHMYPHLHIHPSQIGLAGPHMQTHACIDLSVRYPLRLLDTPRIWAYTLVDPYIRAYLHAYSKRAIYPILYQVMYQLL